jgi:hypothetical protein
LNFWISANQRLQITEPFFVLDKIDIKMMKLGALFLHVCLIVCSSAAFSPSRPTFSRSLLKSSAGSEDNALFNIALTQQIGENEELQQAIKAHPLLAMISGTASFLEIPCIDAESDKTFEVNPLDMLDVACFGSPESVKQWLHNVDVSLGTTDSTDDEKRATGNGDVMAACIGKDTASTCLESGRWESNNIYYPKHGDDMQGWADSAVQAVADLAEKKFWGDGDAAW